MYESADGLLGVGRADRELMGDQLTRIASDWDKQKYDRGELLMHQGWESDKVYVVEEGVFRVVQAEADKEWFQSFRGRGDLLGETAVLNRKAPRTATIWAHTPVRVRERSAELAAPRLTDGNAEKMLLLRYLFSRLQEAQMVQGLADPEVRMAGLLLPLVRHAQRQREGGAKEVVVRISQPQLAQGLRLGRQRTERLVAGLTIGAYHRKGLLTVDLERWEEYLARLRN